MGTYDPVRMDWPRSALALGALGIALALSSCQADAPVWHLAVESIDSPAPAGSGQPQLTVSDRGVLLSWVEQHDGETRLRFVERTTRGWSEPMTAARGTNWFVNWADVPSVLRLSAREVAAHWLEKNGSGTYAYDVRLSYSQDGGRSWSPPVTPHHDGTPTEHGFASLVHLPGEGLGVVWLDGRALHPAAAGAEDAHHGAMSLRFTRFDRDWWQGPEVVLDTRVCDCCPTTAVVTSAGVVAAFRDRSHGEVRDIAVTRRLAGDRWSEPAAVHDDGWHIAACPVNGPMLSARGRDVAVAWFTMQDDEGRAFVAFSRDGGAAFGPAVRLDDGATLGRVDVELLPDGSAAATWIELTGEGAEIRVRRVEASGDRSPAIRVARIEASRSSGYPRMALHGHELVFAWTETAPGRDEAGFHVRTARATLPQMGSG